MEPLLPHVVFFQCAKLSDEQKRKIQSYFQIRRKSGGGECGSVVQVRGDEYSIGFKEKEDQQRVLQKYKHEVGDSLVLIVRDTSPSTSPSSSISSSSGPSATPDVNTAALRQDQSHTPNPMPRTPHQEDLAVPVDRCVIRYLKESPNAQQEIQGRLAPLACRVISVSDETIVVRHVAPSAAAAGLRDWKSGVGKVFNCFVCHYEVDPRKIKALLESRDSRPSSDGVKVYGDIGMATVVGERSQVEAELKDVENRLTILKSSSAGQKQTSIRRVGEAKLHLLCESIESSLKEKFPDVEVTQGDAGQLVLSGTVEEIVSAGKLISGMENMVLERTVSDKSPHFLAFLRKVYGAPGAFAHMLWGNNEVQIEIGDLELQLFSLSKNKLDETVKKIDETVKDVKFDIPNCSVVPAELLEQIRSKSSEMNQKTCRVEVVLGLDSTLWLLGHAKEVHELSQAVTQFILDQASIKGKVRLPFPELVQLLPNLLQQHGFDLSGVTLHPLASAAGPVVALEGPQGKVTEVKNRLDPFLGTLVQERITIDLPGAARFFKSPSGKESMVSIARSQKSLIQLEEQPQTHARQNSKSAKYVLQHGIEVLVIQGDMTKQYADALVNPANEYLEHGAGLAAALSTAGGPLVQLESRNIVKQNGKIPVGNAVMTSSGNLKCKKLIHVVGPKNGQGQERPLLEKTVQSALDLAETMNFKSIAIPCISSGLFGVPLVVCSEAIVTAVKTFGSQGGRSLSRIILMDNNVDVVGALQDACDRLLNEEAGKVKQAAATQGAANGASAWPPRKKIHIEILHGTIETQQVDVLVSPLASLNLTSTRVGIALSNVAGPQLKASFNQVAAAGSKPGDVFVVENLTALKSKIVIFVWLTTWDNTNSATQVLRQGIRETLSSCDKGGFTSVAFPLLGTGQALNFPPDFASKVLLEEISAFEQQRKNQTSFVVRVVIHPKSKDLFKAFKSALDVSQSGGATSAADSVRGTFYRCTSATTDKVSAMLGNVTLQMVQGDITGGGTDVLVNTTDFSKNSAGVSKAILTAAGPSVQQELAKLGMPANLICSTGPGLLGCKEIIHASFRNDSQTIRKNCKKILKQCESRGHQSVAFPAINTGQGGMDAVKACKAMLDGMTEAVKDLNPKSLSVIRIVIMQPTIFKAFRTELESRFGRDAPLHESMREKAKQKLGKWQDKQPGPLLPSAPQTQTLLSSSKPPRAVMSVISCGSDVVEAIKMELESELQKHQLERQVDVNYFSRLEPMEVEALQAKIKKVGVSLDHRNCQDSGSGPYMSVGAGLAGEVYVLKGLKEDVLSVVELMNKSINLVLHKDLRDKEEAILALAVQWSIKDTKGAWQELSLHDNHKLEEAHVSKQALVDVMAPTGMMVSVDLKKEEAIDSQTGIKYQVKRMQSDTALGLPSHWEPMDGETFKKVEVQQQSQEYRDIEQGFKKTANHTIQKIERVQNVYLWHAFTVCRERILTKSGSANLGEKLLYHGTSAESCNCIEKNWFDRSYAGAHAALYGKGVYFAVNAQYSASRYSPADKSGLKRLYAARVLTGRYTAGKASMVAPPPRGSDPTDCFDSVVDNQIQPSMFVVFHDDQAYPEYLITFK